MGPLVGNMAESRWLLWLGSYGTGYFCKPEFRQQLQQAL
jgi:hypothetical protein